MWIIYFILVWFTFTLPFLQVNQKLSTKPHVCLGHAFIGQKFSSRKKQEVQKQANNGIFCRAIFILLLIWCYQLLMQYKEMYEHHMRQCHLYDVVIRILQKQRYVARRFLWRRACSYVRLPWHADSNIVQN